MRAEYGDVKLKIGRWLIIWGPTAGASSSSAHNLWHQCRGLDKSLYPVEFTFANWADSHFNRTPHWRCLLCLKKASPKILGAYLLLESDKTSKQIQALS